MITIEGRHIIPIGCSCISQFQIQKRFADHPPRGGFFDWNIATPAASARVMEAYADGSLMPLLADFSAYTTLTRQHYLINRHLPGLYFWHEPARDILNAETPDAFAAFQSKLTHQLANTFKPGAGAVHLLWSNIQPNLKIVTARVTDDWGGFGLTCQAIDRLEAAAARLFEAPKLWFVINRDNCETGLAARPNVFDLGLERSAKYIGPKGHYAPVFRSIAQHSY
ncbi:hypothetical protein [Abyssibius alkaniclasticus]|uniref:hypothetical protein n=1 Tax=Abyssibius alkaniclasticus TaxID=2881234 RepID=UPI004059B56F